MSRSGEESGAAKNPVPHVRPSSGLTWGEAEAPRLASETGTRTWGTKLTANL